VGDLFNDYVKANLTWQGPAEEHPLVNYLDHEGGSLSNPTPDHFLPLLYVLARGMVRSRLRSRSMVLRWEV
jgi:aromatic ring-opening dioxygenase catalytic subunit (LigB family)